MAAHLTQGAGPRQIAAVGSLTVSEGCVIPLIDATELLRRPFQDRIPDSLMIDCSSVSARVGAALRRTAPIAGLLVGFCLPMLLPADGLAKIKHSRAPRPEPELKIVDVNVSPTPYMPGDGPLRFAVNVQLPKELDGATVLEVTSLVSSPSKTSLRFLTHRRPVEVHSAAGGQAERPTLAIELSWDGQDHRKQLAGSGTYSYEVRTKLLTQGEKGLRTMMVAWPKRGTLEVK